VRWTLFGCLAVPLYAVGPCEREREREKEGEWSLFTAAGGVTKHGEGRVIAAYSVHSLARRPL
jgi:hypothetical protein